MVSLSYIGQQYSIYIGFSLFILGIMGNIMNIVILLIQRSYRTTPCTFFFLTISIHDTVTLIIGLLIRTLASSFNIVTDGNSVIFCKMRLWILNYSAAVSTTCVVLVAIDQFLITSRIVRFRQISTIKNAHRSLISVIMFWIISYMPFIIFSDIYSSTNVCSVINPIFGTYINFYSLIFRYIILVSTMIIFGILAYRNIKQTVVLVRQGTDRQWMNMMRMQVILIVIGAMPFIIYSIYLQITVAMPKDPYRLANESFAQTVIYTNVYIQHAVSIKNLK